MLMIATLWVSDLHHDRRSWILLELGSLCDLVGEPVIAKFAELWPNRCAILSRIEKGNLAALLPISLD